MPFSFFHFPRISMICVLFMLPAFLMVFDKVIMKTTKKPRLA